MKLKNTEIIAVVLSEKLKFPCAKSVIATNSFDTNFVAIIFPALTASCQGTPIINANGANA